ncbi:hypothetical protein PTE30175_00405 [Pandoraea terrae]|uniref:Lipoprotein n=1 Tax=Pandoraea terrae TaxID=1537710 RepID=A0A5E4RUP2_9BURK|nr:hypothetical protein [Pandoraea terrae]VVD67186.1 hypothetical protein PTE30175_00405 [Pandoraea terrae]
MKKLVLIGTLLLSACGTNAPLFTSDGRPTQQIQCAAAANQRDSQASLDCDARARSLCGGGDYETLRRTPEYGALTVLFACSRGS